MAISQQIINQIQDIAQITEVVGDYLSLNKKGQNYWACCPFHNERSPSFSVNPAKGIYKCFGCGKGGDSIGFVMEIENVSFVESIKHLAKKYNIEIEETETLTDEQRNEQNEKEALMIVSDFASKFFETQLKTTDEGKIGLSYFKERGFNDKTIEKFSLGYCPQAWDAFSKEALKNGYSKDLLTKSGLSLLTEKNTLIDRFRERVMFPIHNVSGKTIAFGGRILSPPAPGGGEKNKNSLQKAKYINSPESPIYHKSNVLYGIFQAKKTIRESDNCYLTEGYTDVISLHQVGIENVVASSGTSLTIEQIRLIRRFTENITVLYDGDLAGIKASLRGIDLILEEGLNVNVVDFPEKEDPDSYAKKLGSTVFKEYLAANSKDFIQFKAEIYLRESKNEPLKRAEAIRNVVESIVKIPDTIKQSIFYQTCAKIFEIDEQVLIAEGNKLLKKDKFVVPVQTPQTDDLVTVEQKIKSETFVSIASQEREIIRLLLNYDTEILEENVQIYDYFMAELSDIEFEHHIYQKIFQEYKVSFSKNERLAKNHFLHHSNTEIRNICTSLLTTQFELSQNWEKFGIYALNEKSSLAKMALENVLRLKLHAIQKLVAQNFAKLQEAKTPEEEDEAMRLGLQLENIRKQIASHLNNVVLKFN